MEGCGAFFYDDWSWIEFRRPGLHAMLASYNQHLVFAPVAAYQLLFATVGLAHDWPHWLLAAVAHLAWATAVFAYARRRIGPAALLLAAPVVFLGAGWEAVLQGFNTEIMASLARGAAALSRSTAVLGAATWPPVRCLPPDSCSASSSPCSQSGSR